MKKAILFIAISLFICFMLCGCDIVVTYDDAERYLIAENEIELVADEISAIEISWVAGNVIVEKYNGSIHYTLEEGMFIAKAMLVLQPKK